jgi:hypothetical protein
MGSTTFSILKGTTIDLLHLGVIRYPDLIDDHLPERDVGNIWSVLEPLGNILKGS